jgi:hypothetical protein
MSLDLAPLSEDVLKAARRRKLTLLTAESCTAGLLSQLLSDAEEAADYFMAAYRLALANLSNRLQRADTLPSKAIFWRYHETSPPAISAGDTTAHLALQQIS